MIRSQDAPTPVRVVESLAAKVWRGVAQVAMVFLGVLLAVAVTPFTPLFDAVLREWNYVEPTCEDPRSLQKLDIADMVKQGTAVVDVSSHADENVWPKLATFDGRPGSGWVPATRSSRGDDAEENRETWEGAVIERPQIQVRFDDPRRVQLLCMVNGNAGGSVSYTVADRVRTAEVLLGSLDGEDTTHLVPLRTLPEHEVQNRQSMGIRPAVVGSEAFSSVTVRIVDRYLGTMDFDPTLGEQGDWTGPSRLLMVGELEVYVEGED